MKQTFEASLVNLAVLVNFLSLRSKNMSCLSWESNFFCLALMKVLEAIGMHWSIVANYPLELWCFYLQRWHSLQSKLPELCFCFVSTAVLLSAEITLILPVGYSVVSVLRLMQNFGDIFFPKAYSQCKHVINWFFFSPGKGQFLVKCIKSLFFIYPVIGKGALCHKILPFVFQ